MLIVHVPESISFSFDLFDIGAERGYLAWCSSNRPCAPLALIPALARDFTSSMDAARSLSHARHDPLDTHIQARWFIDRPNATLAGPLAPQSEDGLLAWSAHASSCAPNWQDLMEWLMSREAYLLAQALSEYLKPAAQHKSAGRGEARL
jgi:hypothetical protein